MNELARRVQRAHNRLIPPEAIARAGGVLAFSSAGDLIAVWPDDRAVVHDRGCQCAMHRIAFRFPLRPGRVSIAEVRAFLDAALGTGAQVGDLYRSPRRQPLEEPVRGGG